MMLSTKLIAGGLAGAALLASAGAALAAPGAATASVNVRSGPGTGYSVVDTLYPGEGVDIRNCQGSWCYVVHSGPDGWVSANYLTGTGGAPQDYDDYDEPAPVYVEPAPIYTPPPIIVEPPYYYHHHRPWPGHPWPGKPWPGKPWPGKPWPGHPWNGGNPPANPPQGHPPQGNPPGMTPPPAHMPPPMHSYPRHHAGPGNGANFCMLNPDVCKPHHQGP